MKKNLIAVALAIVVSFSAISSVVYAGGQTGKLDILRNIPYTGENGCPASKAYYNDVYAMLKSQVANGKMTQADMMDIITSLRSRVAAVCRMK